MNTRRRLAQKRSLGQIFLNDTAFVRKIVGALDVSQKTVVEIGPGKGQISHALSRKAKHVYCVEIDPRLTGYLQRTLASAGNVTIINSDILRFPLTQAGADLVVFGNIPYHVSRKIIDYLIQYRESVSCAYLTVQKEFADKLLACASEEAYSLIGCRLQYYAAIRRLFDIPAVAFCPVPKVDSTFLTLEFHKRNPYQARNEPLLFSIMQKSFSLRRKFVTNALADYGDAVRDCLEKNGIPRAARAEDLSVKDFVVLADCLDSALSSCKAIRRRL